MMCYICDRQQVYRETTAEIPICDWCKHWWSIQKVVVVEKEVPVQVEDYEYGNVVPYRDLSP